MNVILLEPVNKLGEVGDLVKVRPGYGRNYLIPQGLAVPATKANQAELEARKEQRARMLSERKADAEKLLELIGEGKVTIRVKAGEDRIYGSVGNKDVAEAIEAAFDVQIDRRKLNLTHPLKQLGDYEITYKPHPEVPINFNVSVISEEE